MEPDSRSARNDENRLLLSLGTPKKASLVSVFCHVKPKDYPELQITKEDTPIYVVGEIEHVSNYEVILKDYPQLAVIG